MGVDEDAIIHSKDIIKSILAKFPEAKPELKNMIVNLDKGEAVMLTSVQDVESRLKLLQIFTFLRLGATEKVPGADKSYRTTPSSVPLLRRRFAMLLGITAGEMGNDSDSESSSDSSSFVKKKKKKSKKEKKKLKKEKKEKKKKAKKSKKPKKGERGEELLSFEEDEPLQATPAPVPTPAAEEQPQEDRRVRGPAMPEAGRDDDEDDEDAFGPAMSYRETVGEEAFLCDTGETTIVAPMVKEKEEKTGGRDDWMTILPDSGTGPLGSIAWRHGKARTVDKTVGDKSRQDWVMTPQEKANPKGPEKRDREEDDAELLKYQKHLRDQAANERMQKEYDKANENRQTSLMEMHQQKLKEQERQNPTPAGVGRWDRERDFESAGIVDSKRLFDNIANANSGLKSKFSHGSRHFNA
eukprot:TRINITY_DN4274_c1_g2_i1.p1 TRINITY_DN4274_c1_g2~~TRINITY_DN4274_c1_g2_i1.p1  ORF type:complete len:411 (+),score=128.16 TRINITY_DN4274_c1_g2_i1:137-1369(+)